MRSYCTQCRKRRVSFGKLPRASKHHDLCAKCWRALLDKARYKGKPWKNLETSGINMQNSAKQPSDLHHTEDPLGL